MGSEFQPMRSTALTKYPMLFPCWGSFKIDGIRIGKHMGKALTKSMKPVPNKIMRAFIETELFDGADGESITGIPNDPSVYSKTYTNTMTQDLVPDFNLWLFDMSNMPKAYPQERYARLVELVAALPEHVRALVHVVEKRLLNCQADFDEMYAEALELGYEGLVTQTLDGFYHYGKTSPKTQWQLKHKPEEDVEGEIVELFEAMENTNPQFINEMGKTVRSTHKEGMVPKGMLGGFKVREVGSGLIYKVGPGVMPHDERLSVWLKHLADPTYYPGKLIRFRKMAYGTMANDAARQGRYYGWQDQMNMSLTN